MKKIAFFLSSWFLLPTSSVLAADSSASTKYFLDSILNDDTPTTVTEWYITSDELEKLPISAPASADPPLSLKAAIGIAQEDLKKNLVPQETWSLDSVEVHQIDAGNSGETSQQDYIDKPTGKWFYKVIFSTQRPDPKTTIWTAPYPVYVLMDGSVAIRRQRPQTKEEIAAGAQFTQGLKDAVMGDAKKSK